MSLNVLAGKKSKVKDWMVDWDEYGSGISFGNDIWWKELVRYLLNNDYVIETQAQGMFFSTIRLTDKGQELRTKLLTKYPNYLSLLTDSANPNLNSTQYKSIQIKLPELQAEMTEKTTKSTKSTKSIKSTKSVSTTKSIDKDKGKIKDKDPKEKTNKSTLNKKILNKLNSNSNSTQMIDFKSIGVGSIRTKLSQILNSDSDSD
jgi:hypothetical protein